MAEQPRPMVRKTLSATSGNLTRQRHCPKGGRLTSLAVPLTNPPSGPSPRRAANQPTRVAPTVPKGIREPPPADLEAPVRHTILPEQRHHDAQMQNATTIGAMRLERMNNRLLALNINAAERFIQNQHLLTHWVNARATSVFCCCPPERLANWRFCKSVKSINARASSTALICAADRRPNKPNWPY